MYLCLKFDNHYIPVLQNLRVDLFGFVNHLCVRFVQSLLTTATPFPASAKIQRYKSVTSRKVRRNFVLTLLKFISLSINITLGFLLLGMK